MSNLGGNDDTTKNVGIAMGLVAAAAASTGLGAAVVFFPAVVKLASRRVLAGSLGFAAGVMTYVSFVEIFTKSSTSFQDAGHEDNLAYIYATACFFGGVLIMMALNVLVAKLLGGHGHRQGAKGTPPAEETTTTTPSHHKKTTRDDVSIQEEEDAFQPACCSKDPVHQLENYKKMASVLQHELDHDNEVEQEVKPHDRDHEDDVADTDALPVSNEGAQDDDDDFVDNIPLDRLGTPARTGSDQNSTTSLQVPPRQQSPKEAHAEEENKRLIKMGLNTALAIGLHNFPEGLATFVAALHDPKVGSILAFAIAIHNIPEGLCVALPIFYATGHRLRAFLWALLSGASEVVAALLGWAVLASVFSDNAYAILFGLVAGMMVIISIRELLPTAHFYDPEDTCVTYSFIGGMALMAVSLVMFQI